MDNVKKTGVRMTRRINMGGKKIVELGEPTENSDAVTKRYTDLFYRYLNDRKVSKDGDTMTGDLNMGCQKVTDIGTPTENSDATTKEYVDRLFQHEHEVSFHSVGRYIVLPNEEDGTKTYFSVRVKKNVDLDTGKLIEISSDETYNARPTQIRIISESVELDNPGKDLKILRYNLLQILEISFNPLYFNPPNTTPAPWNLSFSAVIRNTASILWFQVGVARSRIEISWNVDGLTFVIYDNNGQTEHTRSVSGLLQQNFNHVSIEYVDDKLCFWVNGVQMISYRSLNLLLLLIELSVPKLGILSFYNRNLNKVEIVQHFIDYHAQNFTNDEVLI